MGILDEAIREHLELKRQHGAADSELKQLEDEAFGPPERPGAVEAPPDQLAEAPTEFMEHPGAASDEEPEQHPEPDEQPSRREPSEGIFDLQEPPPPPEASGEATETPPEEQSAVEHRAIPEPQESTGEREHPDREGELGGDPESAAGGEELPPGPSTEERQAIAEQPTELYDVEEGFASSQSPSEEELAEEEMGEARLGSVDPAGGLEGESDAPEDSTAEEPPSDDDAFFNEQRLSDELDQALEAPRDFEQEAPRDPDQDVPSDTEPAAPADEPEPSDTSEKDDPQATSGEEDLLEETPDFLEEAPEDDQLWFEQKPPKDFDFDD